ncbi:MAG: hypothetical protein ACRDWD_00510 [Acidimicrobiia bacterium]
MGLPAAARFADTARRLGAAARAAGLAAPAFRSPPRVDAPRTIRRFPDGVVVSVRLRERSFDAVAGDMVEGVLVANRLGSADAGRIRGELRAAAGLAATDAPVVGLPSPEARVAERQTQAA